MKAIVNFTEFKELSFLLFVIGCTLFGCKSKSDEKPAIELAAENETAIPAEKEIVFRTKAMDFSGPDTIPSGWNTIKYINASNETHFIAFEKYPEGKNVEDTKAKVFPVFDKGMTLINEGNAAEGFKAFDSLPAWYFKVVISGGVGLTAPKSTSKSTIKLEPGTYLMECYVKMPNGKFHSVMGMYKPLIVADKRNDEEEPTPTVSLEISSEKGIVVNDSIIRPGNQIIKVTYKDQKLHENFLGHDVHLVKLAPEANVDSLDAWMNWTTPKGLTTPVPDGVTFMGGVEEMPTGNAGYFYANFTPGRYAFVSEVPAPKNKGMLKVFTVKNE